VPFLAYPQDGDIGLMGSEGWVYIVDGKKDMISASGYKMWPRKLEDMLAEHPAVREAAVVGVPNPYRDENVKAYVRLKPGTSVTPGDLIGHCKERMAALQVSPNRGVDRRTSQVGDRQDPAAGAFGSRVASHPAVNENGPRFLRRGPTHEGRSTPVASRSLV
jgi:hypothetical protein